MPEPSNRPNKKQPPKRKPKVDPDLPDDEAIRRLFPKRVVDRVNEAIDHKPPKKSGTDGE